MKPICELKKICKDFVQPNGQVLHVLDGIDLSIYPDEVVAIIGPSGCGKSTLLRILAGLESPTSGDVFYEGNIQKGLLPTSSIVFQSFGLYPWMTIQENVQVVLKALGFSREETEKKSREILDLVGLSGFEETYPKEISGGMKQRVGLARACVLDPTLLLMDEPFSSLDAFTAESLRSEVLNIWKEKGKKLRSIFLISHDIHEVVYMADRIIVLKSNPGKIHQVIENNIPRPRDYRSEEFLDLVDTIHSMYMGEKTSLVKSHFPKALSPLLMVSHDEILGLLNYAYRGNKTHDLRKIGLETHQQFEQVLRVAEAAELLNFIEIVHQTILLTELGKAFLSCKEKERRVLWKRQLLTIPLFIKVCAWIAKEENQTLDKGKLLHFLAKELPYENTATQLKILTRWAHYGGLFIYSSKRQTFRLTSKFIN